MSTLLAFLLGPNGIFAILGAVVVAAFAWAVKTGSDKAEARQAKRNTKALGERLEMNREATAAERKVAQLTDEQARREAMKWPRR